MKKIQHTLSPDSHNSFLFNWLGRPLSKRWCIFGWGIATAIFVSITSLSHFEVGGDAFSFVYIQWLVAHGHLSCGYPYGGVNDNLTAPLYPLLSGGLSALLQIGHSVPFPSAAQFGHHCTTADRAMDQWAARSGAWWGTLRIGFVGWFALMAGVVALLRATGRGRSRWEPAALIALALTPPVSMCLVEFFHPQDLLAMGIAFWSLSNALRGRWVWAGLLIGMALLSQQFTLLIFLPLMVVVPKEWRFKYVGSAIVSVMFVAAPVLLFTSGRAIETILTGTGASAHGISLMYLTGLHSSLLILVSRFLPLALALTIAWWAERRLGRELLSPVPLISLVATSLCMRLIFEINLWGYYFMAVAASLLTLDVISGRIRLSLVGWLVAVTLVAQHVFVHNPL